MRARAAGNVPRGCARVMETHVRRRHAAGFAGDLGKRPRKQPAPKDTRTRAAVVLLPAVCCRASLLCL
jgi:hypothetical protein